MVGEWVGGWVSWWVRRQAMNMDKEKATVQTAWSIVGLLNLAALLILGVALWQVNVTAARILLGALLIVLFGVMLLWRLFRQR